MSESLHPKLNSAHTGSATDPGNPLVRRDFLRLLGLSGVALTAFRPWEMAMAGPFSRADFEQLVPADKRTLARLDQVALCPRHANSLCQITR